MAKLERTLYGNFHEILEAIDGAVLNNSASASFEDGSDMALGVCRCAVRVYERYSMIGGNRVSLSVTLLTDGSGVSQLCAVTSGGSQAVIFKINTFGESAFLDTIVTAVDRFSR